MATWIIFSTIILAILCIFAAMKLYNKNQPEYAKAVLTSCIAFLISFVVIWLFNIDVPSYIIFLAILTVLISCFFGHYLGLYTSSNTFERYLHGFGSFAFSLYFYCIIDHFFNSGSSRLFQAIFIFLLGNTIEVIFELLEAKHDTKSNVKSQKGLKDTNIDMLFNVFGSILAGIFAYIWILK